MALSLYISKNNHYINTVIYQQIKLIIIRSLKLMQSNQLFQIKNLLIQLQTGEVSAAESKLASIQKNDNFFQICLIVLSSSSEQQWLKTVTASYLNSILLEFLQSQQLSKTSQIIKQIICSPKIRQFDKRSFEKSIIELLVKGGQERHRQWQQLILQFLKNKQNYDSAYLVMVCFAVAQQVPSSILREIVQFSFQTIITSLEVSVQNANLLNEMIKMWIGYFQTLCEDQQNNQTLHFMSNSSSLLNLLDKLYDFQSVDNVIICLKPHYFHLNLLKYQATELHKRLLLFSIDSQIKCSILEQYTKKNFTKFARTIHIISLQKSFIEILRCEDLITTLLSIQQLYIVINPQYLNLTSAVGLIQNEIFAFLPINEDEKQKFQQSPEEFNCLAQDCCDHQTYGILKTEAIKLLQTLGDRIQGCLQYAVTRALQSLKLNLGFVSNISSHYPALQIETAFMVLSVFSYGISKLQGELQEIKVILYDSGAKQLPPLQLSRVFTFLAYNYQEIYKNPAQGQGWIQFALQYNGHPTTSYCAFDFLSNNVDDYFNEALLQALINQISTNQIALIWDITKKIIQNHFNKFTIRGCTVFISKLFERINRQIVQIRSKQKSHTLDLVNCIGQFSNILQTLGNQQMKSDQNKFQQILRSIWPITDLYRPALQWNFEDQIVKVIISIIDVIPSIVPELHSLVPQFVDLFKAGGYFQKIYLRFFNQFTLKSNFSNDFAPLIEIILVLKNALFKIVQKIAIGVNGKYQGTVSQRITAGNVLLIIQNIIAFHGTNLPQSNNTQFFNQIASICLKLLPNKDQQTQKTSTGRILTSRTLNTLFLCHMHVPTNCFYDYLARFKDQDLYHGYDTRVFALCVAKEVFRINDFSTGLYLIEGLLQIIGKSAEKDEVLQTKKKAKSTSKLSDQVKKIEDMDKILKVIDSPFKGYHSMGEQIIHLFSSMNSANQELVRNILASLSPSSLGILKNYVDLNNFTRKKRVIVKVMGMKISSEKLTNDFEAEHQNHPKKEAKILEDEESGDEELKRRRNKIKRQGKKKSQTGARKILPNHQ